MNSTMISGFEPYNYEEECTEPEPAKVDNQGGNRLAHRPEAYNCRLRVTQFNRLYKQGERTSEKSQSSVAGSPGIRRKTTVRFGKQENLLRVIESPTRFGSIQSNRRQSGSSFHS